MCSSYYGTYRTRLFNEVFPDKETFRTSYTNVGLGGFNDEKTIDVLYVLLYSRRANDAVMSSDESRFIYDLFGTVFKFGAEFEKKIEIQSQILSLSADELERGTTTVYNRSENPSTLPIVGDFEPLKKINAQTAQGSKKARIDALAEQYDMLDSSFYENFLKKFDRLFNPFPPEYPLYYVIDDEGETE